MTTSPLLSFGAENEYGEGDRRAWVLYGYDMVVEPYRTTILRVNRQHAPASLHSHTTNFHWLLVPSDRVGNQLEDAEPVIDSLGGSHATVELTRPGGYYSLVVREVSEDGYVIAEAKATVACKYVRRELRDLTDADRTAFLEALQIYYTIGEEDGIEKYGEAFTNFERIVALHNSQVSNALYTRPGSFAPSHGRMVGAWNSLLLGNRFVLRNADAPMSTPVCENLPRCLCALLRRMRVA